MAGRDWVGGERNQEQEEEEEEGEDEEEEEEHKDVNGGADSAEVTFNFFICAHCT